ncbi:MAG: hypothetical protein HS117_02135 [Verrucomicrobiaceae bacterium]|nr:hypothetical protein [Verrucomicrobiaceae bacterium]
MNLNLSIRRRFSSASFVTVILLGSAMSVALQAGINDGLVAHYPFEGNVQDVSGNGRSLSSSSTTFTTGWVGGNAVLFNGTTSYLSYPGTITASNSFSWTCWFNAASDLIFNGEPNLMNQGTTPGIGQNGISPSLYITSDRRLRFYTYTNQGLQLVSQANAIIPGRWHFFAITSDGSGNRVLYLDGNQVDAAAGHLFGQVLPNFYIGGNIAYGNISMFKGAIDEVRIYNRALSPQEVTSLASSGQFHITNPRAAQRAGSKLVDINYDLSSAFSSGHQVAIDISADDGATWTVPSSSVTGNGVGANVASGNGKSIQWDAEADWNLQTSATMRFRIAVTRSGVTTAGQSGKTPIDTRGSGGINVTGRALNGGTYAPLAGAAVSLAGINTTSRSNGTFTIANVNLVAASTLTVSAAGLISQTRTVVAAADQKAVNVGDISLATATDNPVVEGVKPDVDGIFLVGFGLMPTLKATVNWNGTTPGIVQFMVNGSVFATRTGAGPEYSVTVPVDSALRSSLSATGNVIAVTATAQEAGKVSVPFELTMAVVPVPASLRAVVNSGPYQAFGPDQVGFDFELTKHEQKVTLPLIGQFGFEWGANASFDYTIKDGAWEAALGLSAEGTNGKRGRRPSLPGLPRSPKAKLYIGNKEINVSINGKAAGTATASTGITLQTVGLDAGLETRLELTRYGLLDIFGPGLTNAFSAIPAAGNILKNASVIIWLIPALDGTATVMVSPFDFGGATLTGKIGLEGAYEPEVGDILKGRVYVGSDIGSTFGLPTPVFKDVTFRVYGGYELTAWVLTVSKEVVWVSYTYPSASGLRAQAGARDIGTGYLLEAEANQDETWRPMDRPWRKKGGEVFRLGDGGLKKQVDGEAGAALEAFASMGQGEVAAPAPAAAEGSAAARVIGSTVPAQAVLPLLGNVFPDSDPALAGNGNNLMLLYVRDTGAANAVQFTEVAWTYFNGTAWTTPAPVAADVRGQFEPAVVFDGQGKAVGVWSRIKNAALTVGSVPELAAEMEIVSATWNAGTGTWSAATALTDNAFLDHKPRLGGPLTDGDLILTWRENQANLLIGTGAAGAPQNTRIMTRRWDAATGTWGAASVLVADLANEMSDSLAASGGKAVYAVTRDLDGNLDDFNDSELFYRVWNEGAGAWGTLTRHTTDAINDRNVKLAVGGAGDAYGIWQRGDDLVMDVNFSGTHSIVRPDSGTFGFSDLALTVGPDGNVAVIWQEMGEHGSDAHYRVYDPISATWGQDSFLSEDSDLERSFAPVWDAAGNLTLAYNNVQISKVTKNVVVEGGATVTVDGVPQPGQVDLLLAKRALVKDLAAVPEGLTADGTTFLPGDALTLKARVKNAGNLAVQNVQVAFYDGDPANGGTLIETATIPGWMEAATDGEVTVNWAVPEPAQARTIYIKIDPASAVTESNEANNVLALPINGVDLALEYQSGSVLRDGSARVVVKVRNLSAPESPVTTLRLKAHEGGATLAETTVSQLAPGQSIDVPFDLPAGTQPEGDQAYLLVIDEEDFARDIDRDNNEAPFALTLWIDDDGDGIPRWWELANGMSDSSASNALLDVDGDGFDALAEFLSGTDPNNNQSKLGVGQFNTITSSETGISTSTISWASVAGRLYRVERSFDLTSWQIVGDDLEPTPPLNSITDATTPPGGRVFYRVMVK